MGKCRKTAYNGGKYYEHVGNVMMQERNVEYCENAGHVMVGRGNESRNMGKCRKTT